MRLTKIVATIGPAVDNRESLLQLVRAGVNVFRLNFSHAIHEKMEQTIANIRSISQELKTPVGILADLQGPKFRNYYLKDHKKVHLKEDSMISFRVAEDDNDWGDETQITTKNEVLVKGLKPGQRVLLVDGQLELKVGSKESDRKLQCKVIRGGELGEKKGINVPELHVDIKALTEKDKEDCKFALLHKVDMIALSFVQTRDDIEYLKEFISEVKRAHPEIAEDDDPLIISKIERPQALVNLEDIIDISDGIMVARGDLGVEIKAPRVPIEQKRMIRLANAAGKLVITATQMLESMIEHSTPTRAEVSDVANAVFDATDAVMLSGEVAVGKHPIDCVKIMGEIAEEAEKVFKVQEFRMEKRSHEEIKRAATKVHQQNYHHSAIAKAAVEVSEDTNAAAMIVISYTGRMAQMVSKMRSGKPIVALSPFKHIQNRMTLMYGVYPLQLITSGSSDETLVNIEKQVLDQKFPFIKPGRDVVICSGETHLCGLTNMLSICKFGSYLNRFKSVGLAVMFGRKLARRSSIASDQRSGKERHDENAADAEAGAQTPPPTDSAPTTL